MNNRRWVFASAIALFAGTVFGGSESIFILKNGRKVRGELVGETATTYQVKIGGGVVSIARAEVRTIETVVVTEPQRSPTDPSPPVAPADPAPSATSTTSAPEKGAPSGKISTAKGRPGVVLLRDGTVLEGPTVESETHLRLELPEGVLSIPLRDVREVFLGREARGDATGFGAALTRADALAKFLDAQPRPRRNTLLVRALLREDGREAASAYATSHHKTDLVANVGRWATVEARAALPARHERRIVAVELSGEQPVLLDAEERVSHDGRSIVLRFPEGALRFPKELVRIDAARPGPRPEEDAFVAALSSAKSFAEHVQPLPVEQANTAVLRALLREDGRRAALELDDAWTTRLLKLVFRGFEDSPPVEAAAKALAASAELEKLEGTLVDMTRSNVAWRRRLGLRGLATLHGGSPERLATWKERLRDDRVALASLLMALEQDADVHALLTDGASSVDGLLRLVAEVGRPFPGAAVVSIARSSSGETRRLALAALETSHDAAQVAPLLSLLEAAEDRGDAALIQELERALVALTKLPGQKAATWREAWSATASSLEAALERVERGDPGERVAGLRALADLGVPTFEAGVVVEKVLATERDLHVLEAAIDAAARLRLVQPGVGKKLVSLLPAPSTSGMAHAALVRLYGTSLTSQAFDAWLEVVRSHSFAPPLAGGR